MSDPTANLWYSRDSPNDCVQQPSEPIQITYIGGNMSSSYPNIPLPTNPKFKDRTGHVIGLLTILAYAGKTSANHSKWLFQCQCGTIRVTPANTLTRKLNDGTPHSCGCWTKANPRKTHGKNKTPECKAYHQAKSRCIWEESPDYKYCGGRGIEFRFNSFDEFYEEIGDRPSTKHSLDRIDNDGHYEKGNVRWATKKEQGENRRSNHRLLVNEKNLTITEWGRVTGIERRTISRRLSMGFCDTCAVTLPLYSSCPHRGEL